MNVKYTWVGDSGASLSATLKNSTGDPIDLTDATSVILQMQSFMGDPLGGDVDIVVPEAGKVRYLFTVDDLATAGDYEAVFVIEFPEGTVTYPSVGPPFVIKVQEFNDSDALTTSIVTVNQAFQFTGSRVTVEDLFKAQMYASIYLDLDVTDETIMNYVSESDKKRINQGISHWAVDLHNKPKLDSNYHTLIVPDGVKSVSQGDVTLTFAESSSSKQEFTPPALVQTIFSKLTWRNRKTIRLQNKVFASIPQVNVTNIDQIELF